MANRPKRRYGLGMNNYIEMEENMLQEIENAAFDQLLDDCETMESKALNPADHDKSPLALRGDDAELWHALEHAINHEHVVPMSDLLTKSENDNMVMHQKVGTLAPIGPSASKTASPTPSPTPFGQGGFPSFDPSFIFQPRPPEQGNSGPPRNTAFPSLPPPSETNSPGQGAGSFAVPPGYVLVPARDPTPPLVIPSGFVLVPAPPPTVTPVVPSGFVLVPISQLQGAASSTATTIPALSGIAPGQSVIVLNEQGEQISIQSLGGLVDNNIQPAPSFATQEQPVQQTPLPVASPTFVQNFGNVGSGGNGQLPSPRQPSRRPQTIAFVPQAPTLSIPFVFSTARPFGSITNNEGQSSSARPSQSPNVEQAATPDETRASPESEPEPEPTVSVSSSAPAASVGNEDLQLVPPLINILPDDASRFGQELESSTAALEEQLRSMVEKSGIPDFSPTNGMVEHDGSSEPAFYDSEEWPHGTGQDVHWDYELHQTEQPPSQSSMPLPVLSPYSNYLKSDFSNLPEDFFNLDALATEALAKASALVVEQLAISSTETSPKSFTEFSSEQQGPETHDNPSHFQQDLTRRKSITGYSEISSRLSLSKRPVNEQHDSEDHLFVESSEVVSSSMVDSGTESIVMTNVECREPCPTSRLDYGNRGAPSHKGHSLRRQSVGKRIGNDNDNDKNKNKNKNRSKKKVKLPDLFGQSKEQRRRLCERNAPCTSPAGQSIRFQDIPFAPE
eukprot:CAMPEP_0184697182 /NCGR_PEP_ID=MMETSP0313-20130426/4222_1 /TAXON_ID=2792 /ORGANISM="Porphyridium aerugineum, Strain SAG 1380-2" /LENGTH=732 /DNA_ID=CAMNT_0027155945 /DNA_START=339 /DNA_END=2537 /DNA_ORIENTATION=+